MTATTGPNLRITSGWQAGDNNWDVGMNRNLRMVDSLVFLSTNSPPISTPPANPALGDRYVIGANPTGAWAGHANEIAAYLPQPNNTPAWEFFTPSQGWRVMEFSPTLTLAPTIWFFRNGAWAIEGWPYEWRASRPDLPTNTTRPLLSTSFTRPVKFVFSTSATLVDRKAFAILGANAATTAINLILRTKRGAAAAVDQATISFAAGSLDATITPVSATGFMVEAGDRMTVNYGNAPISGTSATDLAICLAGTYH